MTILVTGATGNIGGEVVRSLTKRNASVRGLVRDPKRVPQDIELAIGDLSQPESLETALQGVEKAFLVLPSLPNQVELECAFIDAAKRAGVQYLVKLSVMRAGEIESAFQKWHGQVEGYLEQSGIAWTHLRPNMLMQNMRWFTQTIAQTGSIYNCLGETRVSHVDARDVAEVAAICLTESGHESQTYTLTGLEAITLDNVARLFSRALNRTISYVDLPPGDLKAARLANGEPEWYLDAELELCANWRQGFGTEVTSTIADLTYRDPTTFAVFIEDFVRAHAQDFQVATRTA